MSDFSFKYTNHLISQSSPYLLQHAHNPVDWYPWGEEALNKARTENKLLIISIGYAACHWCHVMEHESFEDEQVASFMNEHFVPVKVDREERPDIDQVYMNAVQLITRQGGWPLNCIALPDGRPVYGGTYFPKQQWLELLSAVLQFVKQYPGKAEEQAKALLEGINFPELNFISPASSLQQVNTSLPDLVALWENWKTNLDLVNGGNKGAPKFPMPCSLYFLLIHHHLTGNPESLQAVLLTLDKMSRGGIYDHVGGGFSRYATDAVWKVPHFEKMLYDNAQLITLYAYAFQLTRNENYKVVVSETIDFVERELTSGSGGFFSSLDADSEGEEGKFYTWTAGELKDLLHEKFEVFADYFNVSEKGNWENSRNILYRTKTPKESAGKYGMTETHFNDYITSAKEILRSARVQRIPPALDNKILVSWNAMMIKACIDAFRVFGSNAYLDSALKQASFILENLMSADNRLSRNFNGGKAAINAFLDDYAFTISAFISIYQATFDEKWLILARSLLDYTLSHFYNLSRKMFYYTSDIDPPLVARKMEISDNVIPSSNSEMAKNLFLLGHYFYREDYINKAALMIGKVKEDALNNGIYYANWDILLAWMATGPYEIAIIGDECLERRKEFDRCFLPNVIFYGGMEEGALPMLEGKLIPGQTTIYVCRNKVCGMPVKEVEEALKQI